METFQDRPQAGIPGIAHGQEGIAHQAPAFEPRQRRPGEAFSEARFVRIGEVFQRQLMGQDGSQY
jgi:hypothetical protein